MTSHESAARWELVRRLQNVGHALHNVKIETGDAIYTLAPGDTRAELAGVLAMLEAAHARIANLVSRGTLDYKRPFP